MHNNKSCKLCLVPYTTTNCTFIFFLGGGGIVIQNMQLGNTQGKLHHMERKLIQGKKKFMLKYSHNELPKILNGVT